MNEYKIGLLAIVTMVLIVSISTGPTGAYLLQKLQPPAPLDEVIATGAMFAPTAAEYCTEAMRYQGREYSTYLSCCSDTCLPSCSNTTFTKDCVRVCGRTCRNIMTQNYLDLEPGTWR